MKNLLIVVAALFLLTSSAQADGPVCKLSLYASLPFTVLADHDLAVPVTIEGHDVLLSLGLGEPFSYVSRSFSDSAALALRNVGSGLHPAIGGAPVYKVAIVASFKIGNVTLHDTQILRLEQSVIESTPPVAGELGEDVLRNFDVELDFTAMTMKLFSHDHCPGHVVYWANSYATLPLDFDEMGHASVTMQLDRMPVSVGFVTEFGPGQMALATATRIFGLNEKSPNMTPVSDRSGKVWAYQYPFQALSVDGISIAHPLIALRTDSTDCRPKLHFAGEIFPQLQQCFGQSELNLGLTELRKLHLFFAYGEKMLYLTAASPSKAQ